MKVSKYLICTLLVGISFTIGCGGLCYQLSDKLGDNTSKARATAIVLGQTMEASTEFNNSDYFRLSIDEPQEVQIEFKSLGGAEEYGAFKVWGPDGELLCGFLTDDLEPAEPEVQQRVGLMRDEDGKWTGYKIHFPAEKPGDYIIQSSISGFTETCTINWKYEITATQRIED